MPDEGMAGAARELPADLTPDVASAVVSHARVIAEAAAVRGVARIDFMTDVAQLTDLIDEAVTRPAYRPVCTGADGRLLRSAASVAAKLA